MLRPLATALASAAWLLAAPALAGPDAAATTDAAVSAPPTPTTPRETVPAPADPRYAALPEVSFRSLNGNERVTIRPYRPDGTLDPDALARLSRILRDRVAGRETPVVPRTVKLLVRVLTRFGASQVEIISGFRSGLSPTGRTMRIEGYHGTGSAIDFRIPDADMRQVAAYARTFAHVGVGWYPNRNFVHLDSRETSFFWVNATRGRGGRDNALPLRGAAERDRHWTLADDLPWDERADLPPLHAPGRTHGGSHATAQRSHGRRHHDTHGRRRHRSRRRHLPLHVFTGDAGPR